MEILKLGGSMSQTASQILQNEFHSARAKIIELAAIFDRLDRAGGGLQGNPQFEKLLAGVELLMQSQPGRAEQIQLLMSRPYEPEWREWLKETSR